MKTSNLFIFLINFMIGLNSCQNKSVSKDFKNTTTSSIKVDNLILSEEELGFGCITNYYRKGDKAQQEIYVQTSSKDDKYWVNYISINGEKEVFNSQNDAMLTTDENGYTLRLENERYIIDISAKMGKTYSESDTTLASGTLKITRKSDQITTTIIFDGGTAC